MTVIYGILSILFAFASFFYFQMPMFVHKIPLSWLLNYGWKRMLLRLIALCFFIIFINANSFGWQLILIGIPFFIFWTLSFFLKSNIMFKALSTNHITKNNMPYSGKTEVVGFVSQSNESVCYPIYEMVSSRHIVNDILENEKIMITYCPACGSCMIFNRVVNGKELHFEVANGIYRRNMLMTDNVTNSIWQQSTGECIAGTMKGAQLEFLPYQQMNAEEWLKIYPNTFFVYENHNAPKALFSQEKIAKLTNKLSATEGPPNRHSKTLALNEKVWGIEINGFSKAYPISELKKITHITDKVGNVEIEINYSSTTKKIIGKEIISGKQLYFQFHWWIGWVEFHQNSEVWKVK